MDLTELDI